MDNKVEVLFSGDRLEYFPQGRLFCKSLDLRLFEEGHNDARKNLFTQVCDEENNAWFIASLDKIEIKKATLIE